MILGLITAFSTCFEHVFNAFVNDFSAQINFISVQVHNAVKNVKFQRSALFYGELVFGQVGWNINVE